MTQQEKLNDEIRKFALRLKREFAGDIDQDRSGFRSRVIGKLRVFLPRKRPGRQGSPEIQRAVEIYEREFRSQVKPGNWHSIAKQVIPGYAGMPLEIQKYRRMQLRANAHSHLYDARTRRRRTAPITKQQSS